MTATICRAPPSAHAASSASSKSLPSPAPVIIGDAVTFLIAVATLLAIRMRENHPAPSGQRWLAELTAGARHITRTVVLRQLTITTAVVVTAYGLSETIPFAVVSQGLHKPAPFLGILISAQGIGAIAAGITAAPLIRWLSEGLLASLGMASAALGYLLLIAAQLPAVLAGCALLGASLSWIIAGIMTLFQRRTPPELMGRTDAAFTIGYAIPQTLAIALGAGLMALAAGYLGTRREQRQAAATGIPEPAAAMAD